MQRFKDFTKKSGKVASAILSAAMVTSMVAGTNVVYAATETTEATTNATEKSTENQDKKAVDSAIAEYVAAVKDLPVTAKTTSNVDLTADNGIAAFRDPADTIEKKYNVDVEAKLEAIGDDKPTSTEKGKRKLTVKVTKDGTTYNSTRTVEYNLDTLNARTDKAKKMIENILADFKPGRDKQADESILNDRIKEVFEKEEKGIKIYEDIKPTASVDPTDSTLVDADGKTEGVTVTVNFTINDGVDEKVNEKVEKKYTVASAKDRVKAATEEVKKYLTEAKNLSSDPTELQTSINNYLANNGYSDVVAEDKDGNNKIEASNISEPSTFLDGEATIKFKLSAKYNDGLNKRAEGDEVKDVTITLLSDQTKTDTAAAELKGIADKITVTADTDVKEYSEDFKDELKKLYAPKYASVTSAAAIGTVTSQGAKGGFELTPALKAVYGDEAVGAVEFSDNDATSDKDGAKKVIITVCYGKAPIATIEKVYTMDSAQSEIDKAKTAVEAALDGMTFTSATTKADVEAVVAEALKAYPGVESVVTYVADNGTASVGVTLTKTVNGVTKKATVEKSYSFSSNKFVEKDGKKFYYDANGQLLKNTWLQGTDSPDGYTYYIQNDGSVMQDRLTYHPDGEHVIYFDKDGHEVFDAFVNVKADAQGNPVDYIGYFDTFGYAYVNQTTYGNGEGAYAKDALFYINDYGVLENKGWFQNAAGEIGYAAPNGTLTTSQWSLDQFGRKVYFQANGFLAKGLMTDGVKYYQLDENDGHLVGEF